MAPVEKEQRAQIAPFAKTAERVAIEHGVNQATVKRSADYSRAVNAIAEVAGDAAVCIDGIPLIKRDGSRFL